MNYPTIKTSKSKKGRGNEVVAKGYLINHKKALRNKKKKKDKEGSVTVQKW